MPEFDFLLSGNDNNKRIDISNLFRNIIYRITMQSAPHYLHEMPFIHAYSFSGFLGDNFLIFKADYNIGANINTIHLLSDNQLIQKASLLVSNNQFPTYENLLHAFGTDSFSFNKFIFATTVFDNAISSIHLGNIITEWLNDKVEPVLLENNRSRIVDAIPDTPQYDINKIISNMFVLEDETSENKIDLGKQGTCFYLKDIGFITCDHVLTPNTKCFHPKRYWEKYDIEIISHDTTLDLAIIRVDELLTQYTLTGLEIGNGDQLNQLDHIAVAGFPNYRPGDTGILSPGLVIGFRPVHGIIRFLLNSAIIAGNSGGPVIDSNNRVVGIAVTGADCSEYTTTTENHGAIPIEALKYLR